MSGTAHHGRDQQRTPWKKMDAATAAILDAGWAHLRSVDYKVSARWLFYRLLQDGLYRDKKKDYRNKFLKTFSRARHTCWQEWRPDSLEDDRREFEIRSNGAEDDNEAELWLKFRVGKATSVPFDHTYRQDAYVACFYEAQAMHNQFKKYTRNIDLYPMGGEPSIPYKHRVAKRLEEAYEQYEKPIVVLYFGDADEGGRQIVETVQYDIGRWCSAPVEFTWCGLTETQAEQYGVPDNPDRPGSYQWEALDDAAAAEIITAALAENLDLSLMDKAAEEAAEFKAKWDGRLAEALEVLDEEPDDD